MPFADEMLNLRHEINNLHAERKAMVYRLNRFRAELRKSMARSMSELRKVFNKDRARARSARNAFSEHNQDMVGRMLGAFSAERAAARRNFRSKRA